MSAGIVTCNLRGDVLRINPAAAEILGFTQGQLSDATVAQKARVMIQDILKSRTYEAVTLFEAAAADDIRVIVTLKRPLEH
jgi:PAS domain-containing protein